MNDTHSQEEIQDSSEKPKLKPLSALLNDLIQQVEEKTKARIEEAETELWLYSRKAVIHAFREYGDLEDDKMVHLLSNVLLDMDAVFRSVQDTRNEGEPSETTE